MSSSEEVGTGPRTGRPARYLAPILLGLLSSSAISGVAGLARHVIRPTSAADGFAVDGDPTVQPPESDQRATIAERVDESPLVPEEAPTRPDLAGEPATAVEAGPSAGPSMDVPNDGGERAEQAAPPSRSERSARRATTPTEDAPPPEPEAPLDMTPRARAYREVQRADDGVIEIPRDVLMALAYDEPLMRAQARRVTPWFEDGECRGVRVEGAGPLLQLVGVLDGDVITHAGGIVIDSPHRGLAAWDALRERNDISLGLVRNGRRFTQHYRLVESETAAH